jgi:FkbM family methyltransferase
VKTDKRMVRIRARFSVNLSDLRMVNRLTKDHVIWGYRLLLDREPENESVVEEKLLHQHSTSDLRRNFMLSPEFGVKNRELTLLHENHIVITEIDDKLRLFIDLADSVIGWGIIRGKYETNELDFIRRTVKSGQTVIDIGANIGLFTITMASLIGTTGKLYAFEPLETHANLLARSIAENNFADRIVLERAAVSDKPGQGQLISASETINAGGAYLNQQGEALPAGHQSDEVALVTLDTYPMQRPVHFIKIDVEGAELLALRGARSLLKEDQPAIISEVHPAQLRKVSGCTAAEFVNEIEGLNYNCYELDGTPFRDEGENVKSVVFSPQMKRMNTD